jgi:HlyD family secretion protein
MSSPQTRIVSPEAPPLPLQPVAPDPRVPGRRRWWLFLLVAAVAAGSAGLWYRQNAQRTKVTPAAAIRTAKASKGLLERTIRLTGMTMAEKASVLTAPPMIGSHSHGSGRSELALILEELIPNGVQVKKGDVVAKFDRQYMLLRLDDYLADVVQHENYLKIMYAQLDVRRTAHNQKIKAAKATLDKALLNLRTAPVRSEIQIENFQLVAEEAKVRYNEYLAQSKLLDESDIAAIKVRELDLKQTRLEAQRAQNNTDKMVMHAPLDGMTVISTTSRGSDMSLIQQGDVLHPGHIFMQVVDLRSLVVTTAINQVDADLLRLGAKAHIHVDAYPDIDLAAHVISVGAFARSGGWRRSFVTEVPVRLKFDQNDARVIPNFSVSADIVTGKKENATMIPLECVFTDGPGAESVAYVRNGERWERRPVELGLQSNTAVEVLSGLEAGAVVAAEKVPGELLAGTAQQ